MRFRCLLFTCAVLAIAASGVASPDAGAADQALVLPNLRGALTPVLTQPDARFTVLIFTRTDCPVSNAYAPEVKRLCDRYAPNGVKFWLVFTDPEQSPSAIRKHLAEYKYSCEALRDPDHRAAKLAKAEITPEAAIFSPTGELLYHGRIDDRVADYGRVRQEPSTRDLEVAIKDALAGREVTPASGEAVGCFIADTP